MTIIKCPKCSESLNVKDSGVYNCPSCHSQFQYKHKKVSLLKAGKLKVKPSSIVSILFWSLSIIGIFIAQPLMILNFLGGILVILSALIIMPPVHRAYTKKFPIRLRYALIASFVIFLTGIVYGMNTWTNSNQYAHLNATQEQNKKLEEETNKRLNAELAQKEAEKREEEAKENALKEQSEKEALAMLIAEAKSINKDYPKEVDSVVTDVKGAQDANLKLINETQKVTDSNTNEEKTLTKLLDVISVVDGDTIKVSELGTLRLIGIDTPETVDPRKPVQCFGKEASNKAKSLLTGKKVRLEFDSTQGRLDKYGRTLAYVYTEDGLFFNKEMIEQGFAHEYTYSTPYKYQTEFKNAQKEAQEAKEGLWGAACKCEKGEEVSRSCTACNQATVKKSNWDCSTYSEKVASSSCSNKCATSTPVTPKPTSSFSCNCSKACTVIKSCAEAQYQLNTCGCKQRDADKDGIACDSAPLNCQ